MRLYSRYYIQAPFSKGNGYASLCRAIRGVITARQKAGPFVVGITGTDRTAVERCFSRIARTLGSTRTLTDQSNGDFREVKVVVAEAGVPAALLHRHCNIRVGVDPDITAAGRLFASAIAADILLQPGAGGKIFLPATPRPGGYLEQLLYYLGLDPAGWNRLWRQNSSRFTTAPSVLVDQLIRTLDGFTS